jgi:hypothetical protein
VVLAAVFTREMRSLLGLRLLPARLVLSSVLVRKQKKIKAKLLEY